MPSEGAPKGERKKRAASFEICGPVTGKVGGRGEAVRFDDRGQLPPRGADQSDPATIGRLTDQMLVADSTFDTRASGDENDTRPRTECTQEAFDNETKTFHISLAYDSS